jgi:hypothetical protein
MLKKWFYFFTTGVLALSSVTSVLIINPASAKAASNSYTQNFYATHSNGSSGSNHTKIKGAPDNDYAVLNTDGNYVKAEDFDFGSPKGQISEVKIKVKFYNDGTYTNDELKLLLSLPATEGGDPVIFVAGDHPTDGTFSWDLSGSKVWTWVLLNNISYVKAEFYSVPSGDPTDIDAIHYYIDSIWLSVTYNRLPVMDSVTITPSPAYTDSILTALPMTHDEDGDAITYTYQWKKGGVNIAGETNQTLDLSVAGNGDKGDVITVKVIPNDGTDNGASMTSVPLTISNSPPEVSNVTISPTYPADGNNLTLSYTFSDLDGDSDLGTQIRWYQNDLPVPVYDNTNPVPASATNEGDKWFATVLPSDGTDFGQLVKSNTVIVDGQSPVITQFLINDGAQYTGSQIVNLTLEAIDNVIVSEMIISENSNFVGASWQPYQANFDFNLSSGDDTKVVYVKVRDENLNPSGVVSASIILDTTVPTLLGLSQDPSGKIFQEGDDIIVSGTTEPGSGVEVILYSEPYIITTVADDTTGFWSVTFQNVPVGDHQIKIVFTDKAGNTSGEITIGSFKVEKKVLLAAAQPLAIGGPVEEPTTQLKPAPTTTTTAIQEGEIKGGEEAPARNWTRTLVTILIIVIALGAGFGGYYGYEWWARSKEKKEKPPRKEEPPSTTRW